MPGLGGLRELAEDAGAAAGLRATAGWLLTGRQTATHDRRLSGEEGRPKDVRMTADQSVHGTVGASGETNSKD